MDSGPTSIHIVGLTISTTTTTTPYSSQDELTAAFTLCNKGKERVRDPSPTDSSSSRESIRPLPSIPSLEMDDYFSDNSSSTGRSIRPLPSIPSQTVIHAPSPRRSIHSPSPSITTAESDTTSPDMITSAYTIPTINISISRLPSIVTQFDDAVGSDAGISPLPAEIPRKPSPSTAQRNQMVKLRKHFGEPISEDMVKFGRLKGKSGTTTTWRAGKEEPLLRDEFERDGDDELEDEERKLLGVEKVSTKTKKKKTKFPCSIIGCGPKVDPEARGKVPVDEEIELSKRFTAKWVYEKRGKRWVEDDYQNVLKMLRML